jgi:hypothetical protein
LCRVCCALCWWGGGRVGGRGTEEVVEVGVDEEEILLTNDQECLSVGTRGGRERGRRGVKERDKRGKGTRRGIEEEERGINGVNSPFTQVSSRDLSKFTGPL